MVMPAERASGICRSMKPFITTWPARGPRRERWAARATRSSPGQGDLGRMPLAQVAKARLRLCISHG